MYTNYEFATTFGISALLSFLLSVIVLLIIAAKNGVFRIGNRPKAGLILLPPEIKPVPISAELKPLATYT